jgi:ketosteroid isomerase-like protein
MKPISLLNGIALVLFGSCSEVDTGKSALPDTIEQRLEKLAEVRTAAEKADDLESFLKYYDSNAISMPEYQPTLTGTNEIRQYYQAIFRRQQVQSLRRKSDEIIRLGKTVIEIGTFRKVYTDQKEDTPLTQNGKYWNIWEVQPDGNLRLKGEAFGFFHPVEHPEALTVQLPDSRTNKPGTYLGQAIPFELKAYNALMEKGVRLRDGALRSAFFTDDGQFMPFADSTVTGIQKLRPYLIAYSRRGEVVIDSIRCDTYHYEYLDDYLLEYAQFKVKWTLPQLSGRTEGKGIRIWKRQADQSLKLFREIGTHNHIE